MRQALKAELRKLLSVRSTYGILLFTLATMLLFAGYIFGFRAETSALGSSGHLADVSTYAITFTALIGALVPLLLMAHEYRYSTITYTLTASRHRLTVLFAKFLIATAWSIFFTVLVCVLSPLIARAGIALSGHDLVTQSTPYGTLAWHVLFYGWGFSMAALLLVLFIRNLIGAVAALFLIPTTIEQILTLLLKENNVYLPFTALGAVVQDNNSLSSGSAAIVFIVYLAVGWIIAGWLFVSRDAS